MPQGTEEGDLEGVLMAWIAEMNFVGTKHPRGLGEMLLPAEVREEMLPGVEHHPYQDRGFSSPEHPFSCRK